MSRQEFVDTPKWGELLHRQNRINHPVPSKKWFFKELEITSLKEADLQRAQVLKLGESLLSRLLAIIPGLNLEKDLAHLDEAVIHGFNGELMLGQNGDTLAEIVNLAKFEADCVKQLAWENARRRKLAELKDLSFSPLKANMTKSIENADPLANNFCYDTFITKKDYQKAQEQLEQMLS